MRDFRRLDTFLNGLAADIYPEAPSEPHLTITKTIIDGFHRDGILSAGMRVLDVGCGQGLALEHFRAIGLTAIGVTFDEDAEICRANGFEIHEADQNFMDFPDSSFDFLWCRHVLEHSVMPLFTLAEYYRLVKPGGYVYVEVPAPETSAQHENNLNHYSVLPHSMWNSLIQRSKFEIKNSFRFDVQAPCGPDHFWSFLLSPQKTAV